MNLLDKNNWLNLVLGLLGFFFVYAITGHILEAYGVDAVATATHLSVHYHWLIALLAALVVSLVLVIFFCKPRSPFFTGVAILLGAVLVMYQPLFSTIANLDRYFRREGLDAFKYLIPHAAVLICAGIAYLTAALSNKQSQSS